MSVVVIRQRDRMFLDGWWGARCAKCKAWLTKWDFTEEDARVCGEAALSGHLCAVPPVAKAEDA